jgi:4-amino-4-deoxy-L-arabinose transferase-like glycosyltransferase
MIKQQLGLARVLAIIVLTAVTLGAGLGSSGRLTYHEAIWAQSAREVIHSGNALIPTLDKRPWLEKPPLNTWLIAATGCLTGQVDETTARLASAAGGVLLALGVGSLAARCYGANTGLMAALIQGTTIWTVMRGRLAEVDILLACMVTWAIVAFDRLRSVDRTGYLRATKTLKLGAALNSHSQFFDRALNDGESEDGQDANGLRESQGWKHWRWFFFGLLGMTALAKGIGFGAVLIVTTVIAAGIWNRDWQALHRLAFPAGWAMSATIALIWPILILVQHPSAWQVWVIHVSDRLTAHPQYFASESWFEYVPAYFWQTLPWTPLGVAGLWSRGRFVDRSHAGQKRLLVTWAVVPAALVSMASVRNAHYLIYALPPWSIWAAVGLERACGLLKARGWSAHELRQRIWLSFGALSAAYAVGYTVLGPLVDRRGAEWVFYERAGQIVKPAEPIALLYDDWDRKPYLSPFGSMPHDLAVRLFYLKRAATWCVGPGGLEDAVSGTTRFAVIGRNRDLPALKKLGSVRVLSRGPTIRWDRTFVLFEVTRDAVTSPKVARRQTINARS